MAATRWKTPPFVQALLLVLLSQGPFRTRNHGASAARLFERTAGGSGFGGHSWLPPSRRRKFASLSWGPGSFSEAELSVRSLPLSWIAEIRGGETKDPEGTTATISQQDTTQEDEDELSEKVRRAMIKLGLTPPGDENESSSLSSSTPALKNKSDGGDDECEGGVCKVEGPPQVEGSSSSASTSAPSTYDAEEDADVIAARLAAELEVDESLCLAAIGATASLSPDGTRRKFDEASARQLLKQELDRIATVGEESEAVQQLVAEGYDPFLSRRALAFSDGNMEDARAILDADRMDEKQEEEQKQRYQEQAATPSTDPPMKMVTVDSSFDPAAANPASLTTAASSRATSDGGLPKPARKEDVVFEAGAAQIQELVLESPVPVLLDVYADWCGPCKVLGPALEEMSVKSGGAFRLVKVNADNERAVTSSALGVTALPTVFGIRNGKILNMFQGMPRSESFMKSFMMGLLVSESEFDPPVTPAEKKVYGELTSKLIKVAGASSFPFSARERLQDRVVARLDELANEARDFVEAEESTQVLKSLLSNVIRDPTSIKFRTVNLSNKVIEAKIGRFSPSVAILKSVGFVPDGVAGETLILGKGKKMVNVAPLMTARECIEKWVDKSRYEVAKAARRRRDEEERAKLQLMREDDYDEEEESGDEQRDSARKRVTLRDRDPDACTLKVRFDGKNKIHELALRADDPLSSVLERLAVDVSEEIQITCIAKRLTVSSLDPGRMQQSLRSLGLAPSSYLVVSVGERRRPHTVESSAISASGEYAASSPSLAERAAAKQKQKRGSHTMQSVGIYSKDDSNKAELIDGGGGVWYEHDVTDDENEEEAQSQQQPKKSKKSESAPSVKQDRPPGNQPPADNDASEDEEADEGESGSESSDYSDLEEEL